jgi:alpha-amylase
MPDGKSDCSLCTVDCDTCKGMPYQQAYDPTSTGYDKGDGKYTRTHRDIEIVNAMRSWMGLSSISTSDYATSKDVAV